MITRLMSNILSAILIGSFIALIIFIGTSAYKCGYMTFVYQERTPIAYLIGLCEKI